MGYHSLQEAITEVNLVKGLQLEGISFGGPRIAMFRPRSQDSCLHPPPILAWFHGAIAGGTCNHLMHVQSEIRHIYDTLVVDVCLQIILYTYCRYNSMRWIWNTNHVEVSINGAISISGWFVVERQSINGWFGVPTQPPGWFDKALPCLAGSIGDLWEFKRM